MRYNFWWILLAFLGASAVLLGAFGAHGLESQLEQGNLTAKQLGSYQTGVRYQFYHTFALGMLLLLSQQKQVSLNYAARAFVFGILLFSGSIYLLSLRQIIGLPEGISAILGPITPLGGLLFVLGWIFIPIGLARGGKLK